MPTEFYSIPNPNIKIFRRDWTKHYINKGCHPIKAKRLADEKARRRKPCPFI